MPFPTRTNGVTHPERDEGPAKVQTRRIGYVAFASATALVVGLAVVDGTTDLDVFGVSADTVLAEGGGVELEVKYPSVTRPALATPFEFLVHRPGGFDGPIEVALDRDWLELWDYQALYPEPTEWTGDADSVTLSFEPPDGDVLRVALDARIQPSAQSGRDGWVAVLGDEGAPVVRVDFETAVRP